MATSSDEIIKKFQNGCSLGSDSKNPKKCDPKPSTSTTKNDQITEQKYELLTTSDLITKMKDDIQSVVNVLDVSKPVARLMLNHYKWDVKELMKDFYEGVVGLDGILALVDIDSGKSLKYTVDGKIDECAICLINSTKTSTDFVCGQHFCDICCRLYFEGKIFDGEVNRIECPHKDCRLLFDDKTILKLISEKAKQRWKLLIPQSFVLSNPMLRYCESEDCEYVVKIKKKERIQVICKCGFESCLECGKMWHESIACGVLEVWIDSLKADSEVGQLIGTNAKQCPSCTVNIEKNGGCNHMLCRSCRHEFCWVCMRDWQGHVSAPCHQFQQSEQSSSEKLIHYSVRYDNHINSVRLERGLYNSVETRIINLKGAKGLTQNKVLSIQRAVKSLRRSRQLLISTYVFAYFAHRSKKLTIFEDNQRNLELATEDLSWFLEQEITNENIVTMKRNLNDKSSSCDTLCSILLDHIKDGYVNDYWELENIMPPR